MYMKHAYSYCTLLHKLVYVLYNIIFYTKTHYFPTLSWNHAQCRKFSTVVSSEGAYDETLVWESTDDYQTCYSSCTDCVLISLFLAVCHPIFCSLEPVVHCSLLLVQALPKMLYPAFLVGMMMTAVVDEPQRRL